MSTFTSRNTSTSGGKTPWPADLEAQNDGPDEAQREAVVAINNIMGAHVLEVNALFFEELQSFVHVLQTVNSHTAFCGLWLWRTPIIITFISRPNVKYYNIVKKEKKVLFR